MMRSTFASVAVMTGASAVQLRQSEAALDRILAQLGQASITHTCDFVQSRNKQEDGVPDYESIVGSGTPFTDSTFPYNDALYWPGDYEYNEHMWIAYEYGDWKRIAESFSEATLWGDSDVTPEDIRQGSLGNCWFLSAASAMAERPDRIKSIIDGDAVTAEGIYAVNFWSLGVPHTIFVDDFLPVHQDSSGQMQTIYADLGYDNSMWMPILEKAFAKYSGNYYHMMGGLMHRATHYLNGSPFESHMHSDMTESDLWDWIVSHDETQDIIQSGTHAHEEGDEQTNERGIVYQHAYTLLSTHMADGTRLLLMRNPWGTEKYTGPWCDSCEEWTDERRSQVTEIGIEDDGLFYIPFDVFYTDFQTTEINLDTSNMHYSSFLMLDDDTEPVSEYLDYRQHELTVTSHVDQVVHVMGNLWPARMLTYECWANYFEYASMYVGDLDRVDWYEGPVQVDIELKAGDSVNVAMVLYHGQDEYPNDWSLVAWGHDGGVTVEHNDGLTSDKFYTLGDDYVPNPTPEPEDIVSSVGELLVERPDGGEPITINIEAIYGSLDH